MKIGAGGHNSRRGFSLVELLVVVAIIILVMAILLPTLSRTLSDRRQVECANNLRNIGLALASARIQGGQSLAADGWETEIVPYLGEDAQPLRCPEHDSPSVSYGMNNHAHRFDDLDANRIAMLDYQSTVAKIVVQDIRQQDAWSTSDNSYAARHRGQVNTLLHSGAVRLKTPESIDPRATDLWLGNWRPHQDTFVISGAVDSAKSDDSSSPRLLAANNEDPPTPEPPYEPGEPIEHPVPSYPPFDLGQCGETLIVADDGEDEHFSTTYDPVNNYTNNIEISPGFILPLPNWEAYFRYPGEVGYAAPTELIGSPVDANYRQAEGHQQPGTTAATFTFDVDPGRYNIWVHWPGHSSHSDTTPITVYDNNTEYEGRIVNQKMSSEQYALASGQTPLYETDSAGVNHGWYPMGEYESESGTIRVVISAAAGAADGIAGKEHLVIADAVRIECSRPFEYAEEICSGEAPPPADEAQASLTAGWQTVNNQDAYGSTQARVASGSGDETATFRFDGVVPGKYRFWTTFIPGAGQATNAPFTVFDGNNEQPPVLVDQSQSYRGVDLDGDGRQWHLLGEYDIPHVNNVRVTVSNDADGTVIADAVRITCAHGTSDCPNGIEGRECRRQLAKDYGSTEETEEAVENGLNWIARHQYEPGYWSYHHGASSASYLAVPEPCLSQCPNEGQMDDERVAATAMALLPFLGAGIGPNDSEYGAVVAAGVNYLLDQVITDAGGTEDGKFRESENSNQIGYQQAIGSLALLEALGVCRQSGFGDVDQSALEDACQLVVNRIVICQLGVDDPYGIWGITGGGWRYNCLDIPDISVTAWMVEALKAADAIGIAYEIDEPVGVMDGVRSLLSKHANPEIPDSVYGRAGSSFGYRRLVPQIPPPLVMTTGSPQIGRHLSLMAGIPRFANGMILAADLELARIPGDFENDSYRNYHAHQFMHGMGAAYWESWEVAMRQYLLETNPPASEGHVRGSWDIGDSTGIVTSNCGRLWDTVAATLALQQYYRNASSAGRLPSTFQPGDLDGDEDIDVVDILKAFENFTGPNFAPPPSGYNKTRIQGDVHPSGGDGDVDSQDLLLLFEAYTGPSGN